MGACSNDDSRAPAVCRELAHDGTRQRGVGRPVATAHEQALAVVATIAFVVVQHRARALERRSIELAERAGDSNALQSASAVDQHSVNGQPCDAGGRRELDSQAWC